MMLSQLAAAACILRFLISAFLSGSVGVSHETGKEEEDFHRAWFHAGRHPPSADVINGRK